MNPAGRNPAIVIIGAGFGGMCMAMQLKRAGYHDFVILEAGSELGGTWRDNGYPGCACDVPSHMYSFSFELNPDWSRMFAPRREIWDYMLRCAARYGLAGHIRYGRRVERMEWDDATGRWSVVTSGGEVQLARAVVSGIGVLHVPSVPEIPGAELFTGPAFHSARWDPSFDASGKRVAVIGTGASAIGCMCSSGRRRGCCPGPTSRSRPPSGPRSGLRRRSCGPSATPSTGCSNCVRAGSRCTPG
jgi:cation diffusion facilitator CzcD-associated flavoprotein CzcO